MEAACLRHTELPHTSRLFSDFLYHFSKVETYYPKQPRNNYPDDRRRRLVAALAELNDPSPSLDLLGQSGTAAIVTGQQVGLFSGPAYTLYKALTAVKMARRLTDDGQPAVPLFWLATEDHDFAEVNHVWTFDAQARPVRIEVSGPAIAERPVGDIPIESWQTEEFERSLAGLPFADEVEHLVKQAYQPGASMGAAFHRLLKDLLQPYGLIFIDPLRQSIRDLAAPLLEQAVRIAPDLNRQLLARNRELTDAGYHAQVHVEESTSLFFVLDGARRIALKRQNGGYTGKDRKYSADELAALAPHLSPNALLRPVVQDYIIPTAAYIGGPAEVAYFAQSQVLYDALQVNMPRVMPRAGFTLIDNRSAKLMRRYQVRLPDFFHGEEALREKMAGKLIPPDLDGQFNATSSEVKVLLDRLQNAISRFDPTLGSATGKSASKITYQLSKTQAKVARETMRRDHKALTDSAWLLNNLFPNKHLQERFYSILPFLARHGFDLVDNIYQSVHLDCPDHILLEI